MYSTVQNNDVSFGHESEASGPATEQRRWSLSTLPTEDNIVRKRVLSYTTPKPTMKMVMEAIKVIGTTEEKGASVAAITKWIIGNYAILDMDRVKMSIKKAILKALEQRLIQRSVMSKGALGTAGSFVLGNKKSLPHSSKKGSKSKKSTLPKQAKEETKLQDSMTASK